ncbi:SIMPL domain-containing protein [Flavihumibacter petaseus]|nr:SIMPL domain-containing protein [Flavihumibacter petaseus]
MNKAILLAIVSGCLFSCNDSKREPGSIKVSGEGKIRVKPDLVILTIDVSFVQPRMSEAVRLSQATVDSVVNILAEFGSKQNDIKTSSISANKEYNYNGRRNVFVGYKAEQSIDFVLNDISQFTDLTAKLLATRINSISQVQFGHSKADSLLRETDLLAYDDALKSAHKLCDRADVKLGKLKYLTNTETGFEPSVYSNMGSINTFNKSYGGEGFKVSPEILVFMSKVISEYEISN